MGKTKYATRSPTKKVPEQGTKKSSMDESQNEIQRRTARTWGGQSKRTTRSDAEMKEANVGVVKNATDIASTSNGILENVKRIKEIVAKATRCEREKHFYEAYGSPHGLNNLLKELGPAQLQAIKDIGFSGLLEMKITGFYQTMMPFLLESYHGLSRVFDGGDGCKCVLSADDVYDVFLIPTNEGNSVPIASIKRKDNPDAALLQYWKDKFGVESGEDLKAEVLADQMIEMKEGGDDFKRFFVLYVMGTILVPTPHNTIDLHLTKALMDVEKIKEYDWCEYVLDQLGDVVDRWKRKRTKSVGGCILLLQIIYFHRLVWRAVKEPTDLPLIQHWTYEKIKKRVKEEKSSADLCGKYGMGVWDGSTYPICPKLYESQMKAKGDATSIQEITPGARRIFFDVPTDMMTDEEIGEKSVDKCTRLVNVMKRNVELIARLHAEALCELKREIQESRTQHEDVTRLNTTQQDGGTQQDGDGFWTQQFNKPEVLEKLDRLMVTLETTTNEASMIPSFSLGIPMVDAEIERINHVHFTRWSEKNKAPSTSTTDMPLKKPTQKKRKK